MGEKRGPALEKSMQAMMIADALLIAAPYAAEWLGAFGYDKVVLWSGNGAQTEAEALAMKEGAWILNATRAGAQAEAQTAGLPWQLARPIFNKVSDEFTRDLTGKIVHAVLRNPSAGSIWSQTELLNLVTAPTWRAIIFH